MAVQKSKKSKSKTAMRKSANMRKAKRPVNLVEDSATGELKRPHHVSPDGFYAGRDVLEKAAEQEA
ncbi:MAG: 50S ribosomal protein L32 [Alphaproteobacteria bacterium CG11_big_fil_rev_8_21_14_0_20_44_7]|nr:MAG: 50S ribosomal protein L32 [Alphaproteobacteria bacterium CG11_big_fil_rev_8_21_14_0_20_44_7]